MNQATSLAITWKVNQGNITVWLKPDTGAASPRIACDKSGHQDKNGEHACL